MNNNKTIHMVAGLPRSGSTLLMNILGQNPKFYVTPTSGILQILLQVKNSWDKNSAFRAMDADESEDIKRSVLKAILHTYFEHVEQLICFDKNRGWPASLEMMAELCGGKDNIKVLLTVRDIRDVLASFEMLHRKTVALGITHQEYADPKKFRTAIGRLETFIDQDQPVGMAFNIIRDAFTRGWSKQICIVEYEKLTSNPADTMKTVYEFLGYTPFEHDFDNVKQLTIEDDTVHGFKELHTIRPKVEPQTPNWPEVFDDVIRREPVWEKIEMTAQFWREYQISKS